MTINQLIITTKGMIETTKDNLNRVRTKKSKRSAEYSLHYFESVLGVLEKQAKVEADENKQAAS